MIINKTITTSEVKRAFNKEFPGLKIEFFNHGHKANEMSKGEDLVEGNIQLQELNAELYEGELHFDPESTAIQFENELKDKFGLNSQVYRRSNQIWLQTSQTDNWSLSEQNRKGVNSQK